MEPDLAALLPFRAARVVLAVVDVLATAADAAAGADGGGCVRVGMRLGGKTPLALKSEQPA